MLYRNPTTDKMSSQRDILADLHDRFVSRKDTSKSYKVHSPTSTLSSGYESGCMESEIDEMLYSRAGHRTLDTAECEYFELESDQYVCLDRQSPKPYCPSYKIQRVRDSMMKIISDLESLGYETSLDRLSEAVHSSVKPCPTSSRSPSMPRSNTTPDYTQNNNNNNVYTKSPVDELFTEIKHQRLDAGSKEKLYDSLITNLAIECSSLCSDYNDEPIYEEIYDDSDFDFVSHSDTYRKPCAPPALPPRTHKSQALDNTRTPNCLTEVQKVTCRKSSTWQAVSV